MGSQIKTLPSRALVHEQRDDHTKIGHVQRTPCLKTKSNHSSTGLPTPQQHLQRKQYAGVAQARFPVTGVQLQTTQSNNLHSGHYPSMGNQLFPGFFTAMECSHSAVSIGLRPAQELREPM